MSIFSFSYYAYACQNATNTGVTHIRICNENVQKNKKSRGNPQDILKLFLSAYLLNSATLKEQAPSTLKIAAKIAPIPKE